jgi:hypothetical protein
MRHVVHVFRYLSGTVDLAMTFEEKGDPVCFVDAGDVDSRRSTTEYAFMLYGSEPVSDLL